MVEPDFEPWLVFFPFYLGKDQANQQMTSRDLSFRKNYLNRILVTVWNGC